MIDTDVPLKIPREDFGAPDQSRAPRIQVRVARLPAIATVAAISAAPATAAVAPATTPTAATAMAAAPAAISAAPAGTAASALCLGTCFIHDEVSPAEILTVQGVHRAIRIFVVGNFNEGEPARPWLQRSVASSRKLTPFATEIVPRARRDSKRAAKARLFTLRRKSDTIRPLCSPPERPYARHDDGFSADAAHYSGALRQNFF